MASELVECILIATPISPHHRAATRTHRLMFREKLAFLRLSLDLLRLRPTRQSAEGNCMLQMTLKPQGDLRRPGGRGDAGAEKDEARKSLRARAGSSDSLAISDILYIID